MARGHLSFSKSSVLGSFHSASVSPLNARIVKLPEVKVMGMGSKSASSRS